MDVNSLLARKIQNIDAKSPEKQTLISGNAPSYGLRDQGLTNFEQQYYEDPLAAYMQSPEGVAELTRQSAARRGFIQNAPAERSWLQAGGDTALGVASGAVGALGGMAGLGLGLVSPELGQSIAQNTQAVTQGLQGWQSDRLNYERQLAAQRQAADERTNAANHTGVGRVAADFWDQLGNLSGAQAGDITAQAAGSMLPAMKAASVLGKLGAGAQAATAAGSASLVQKGVAALTNRTGVAIGSMAALEAGGAYSEGVDKVLSMKDEDLKELPLYQEFLEQGMTHEEAKQATAQRQGMMDAAITGAAAGVLGKVTGAGQALGSGYKVQSLGQIGKNIVGEAAEEAGLAAISGTGSNAVTRYALGDDSQHLLEGVGSQVALGAVGGLGASGAMSVPGAGASVLGAVTQAKEQKDVKKLDRLERDLSTAIQPSETDTPEVAAQKQQIASVMNVSEDQFQTLPEPVKQQMGESRSTAQVIGHLAHEFQNAPTENKIQFASELLKIAQNTDPGAIELPEDSLNPDLQKLGSNYAETLSKVLESDSIKRTLSEAKKTLVEEAANLPRIGEDFDQEQLEKAAELARVVPEAMEPETLRAVRAHADELNLSQDEVSALDFFAEIQEMTKGFEREISSWGKVEGGSARENISAVASQILRRVDEAPDASRSRETEGLGQSLDRFKAAIFSKNIDGAQNAAKQIREMAITLNNKVAAFNESLEMYSKSGDAHQAEEAYYSSHNRRSGARYQAAIKANPRAYEGIRLGKQIASEAGILTAAINSIAEKFPQLGIKEVEGVDLDASMDGSIQEVHQRWAANKSPYQGRGTPRDLKSSISDATQEVGKQTAPQKAVEASRTAQTEEAKATPAPEPEKSSKPLKTASTALSGKSTGSTGSKSTKAPSQMPSAIAAAKAAFDAFDEAVNNPDSITDPVKALAKAEEVIQKLREELGSKKSAPQEGNQKKAESKVATKEKDQSKEAHKSDSKPLEEANNQEKVNTKEKSEGKANDKDLKQESKQQSSPESVDDVLGTRNQPVRKEKSASTPSIDVDDVLGTKDKPVRKDVPAASVESSPASSASSVRPSKPTEASTTAGNTPKPAATTKAKTKASKKKGGKVPPILQGAAFQTGQRGTSPKVAINKENRKKFIEWAKERVKSLTKEEGLLGNLLIQGNENNNVNMLSLLKQRDLIPSLMGAESPYQELMNRLSSFPEKQRDALTAYLQFVPEMVRQMNINLNDLDGHSDAYKQIMGAMTARYNITGLAGTNFLSYVSGDLVQNKKGDTFLQFDKKLAEAAAIAALIGSLQARRNGLNNDIEDLDKTYSENTADVQSIINFFGITSPSQVDVMSQAAPLFLRLIGLRENSDVSIGENKIAAQGLLVEAFQAMSQINVDPETPLLRNIRVDANVPGSKKNQFPEGYIVVSITSGPEQTQNRWVVPSPITQSKKFRFAEFADLEGTEEALAALESLEEVMIDNEEDTERPSIGSPIKDITPNVRNSDIPLSKQQRAATKDVQETPFTLNKTASNFWSKMPENWMYKFTTGQFFYPNEDNLNPRLARTLEGLMQGMKTSFLYSQQLIDGMNELAKERDLDIKDVEVFFRQTYTSVARAHMTGTATPVGNKLMRTLFKPTWSTMDLTTENGKNALLLAVGQALGVKVHKSPGKIHRAKTNEILEKFQDTFTLLDQFYEAHGTDLDGISDTELEKLYDQINKDSQDAEFSYSSDFIAAVGALLEYGKYHYLAGIKDTEALKNFRSPITVESDGMTNGVLNALMLFGTTISHEFKNMVAKGGVFFGKKSTANEYFSDPNHKDIYETVSDSFTKILKDWTSGEEAWRFNASVANTVGIVKRDVEGHPVMNGLHRVGLPTAGKDVFNKTMRLSNLLLGDVKVVNDSEGNPSYIFKRSFVKNPVTTKIYGSGRRSTAEKILNQIEDALALAITNAYSSGELRPEDAFPDLSPEESRKNLNEVLKIVRDFSLYDVSYEMGNFAVEALSTKRNSSRISQLLQNPKENLLGLELRGKERNFFIEAIKGSMIAAMDLAMDEVLGHSRGIKSFAIAQDYLSRIYRIAYEALYDQKVAQKKAEGSDTSYMMAYGLSRKEENEIKKQLSKIFPKSNFDGFTLEYVKNGMDHSEAIGRSIGNQWNVFKRRVVPASAGVSAQPKANIALGDGNMQLLLNQRLKEVYEKVGEEFKILNVYDGVEIPAGYHAETSALINEIVYDTWQVNPYTELASQIEHLTNGGFDALVRAFKTLDVPERAIESIEAGYKLLTGLDTNLTEIPKLADARDQFLRDLNAQMVSVDQMAASEMPYVHEAKAPEDIPKPVEHGEEIQEYTFDYLKNLLKNPKVPSNTKLILRQTLKTLGKQGTKVFEGSLDQLRAKAEALYKERNLGVPEDLDGFLGNAHGIYDPNLDVIFINSGSERNTTEVTAHEIVHAVTSSKIHDYFHRPERLSPTQKASIEGIMHLLDSISYSADPLTENVATLGGFNFKYKWDVAKRSDDPDLMAQVIDEFMAYGTTEPQLTQTLSMIKASKESQSMLSKLKKFVRVFIRDLLFGKDPLPQDAHSILDHLNYHVAFLARSKKNDSIYGPTKWINPQNRRPVKKKVRFHKDVEQLNDIFGKALYENFGERDVTKALEQGLPLPGVLGTELIENALQTLTFVEGKGFKLDPEQKELFQKIVMSFGTLNKLDPSKMLKIQEIYDKAFELTKGDQKNLSEDQYQTLFGMNHRFDQRGSSSILPVFAGLAYASPEAREFLADTELTTKKEKPETLDEKLAQIATDAFSWFTDALANTKKSKETNEALNDLAIGLAKAQGDRKLTESLLDASGELYDSIEAKVSEFLQDLSERLYGASKGIGKEGTRLNKISSAVGMTLSAIFNEDRASQFTAAVTDLTTRGKGWGPVRQLVTDLVGRTESNKDIFDMIKVVKSKIQQLRQIYKQTVPVEMRKIFSRDLSKEEKTALENAVLRTDLTVLGSNYEDAILNLQFRRDQIKQLEKGLSKDLLHQAKLLASFMMGESVTGLMHKNAQSMGEPIAQLDQLITLYALDKLSQDEVETLRNLFESEKDGMQVFLGYAHSLQSDRSSRNGQKGYVPFDREPGYSFKLLSKDEAKQQKRFGYEKIENLDDERGFYFSSIGSKAAMQQGLIQNVRESSRGEQLGSKFSGSGRAVVEVITDLEEIEYYLNNPKENMIPVYGNSKNQIIALERFLPKHLEDRLRKDQDVFDMLGAWRGRNIEEQVAIEINQQLVQKLHNMAKGDISGFVDINDLGSLTTVQRDAVKLIPKEVKQQMKELRGDNKFLVRKDLLNDVIGYREASIGDFWTGNNNFSPETQKAISEAVERLFGEKAYYWLTKAESWIKGAVMDAKTLIVVKSVIVPYGNMMSNLGQLVIRGIPLRAITRGLPRKIQEIDHYVQARKDQVTLEVRLKGLTDPEEIRRTRTKIKALKDSVQRLSIWPLIERGEFSTIEDLEQNTDDALLSQGQIGRLIENKLNQLPEGMSLLGKYAVISQDTSLFKALQRAVQYGDFVAKTLYYDDLVQRKKTPIDVALGKVSEEFITYDRLAGRTRSLLEKTGLMWFYHFKIRAVKVALAMIRENPLSSLLFAMAPLPSVLQVGSPLSDNLFSKVAAGTLEYSLGPEQGLNAWQLNPWIQLMD